MRRRPIACLLLAIVMPSATLAASDTLFDRYKAASLTAAGKMMDYYETCAPGIAEKVPAISYNAPMDEATACVIDSYADQMGDEAAEELVVEVETWAAGEIATVDDLQLKGKHAMSPELQGIVQACGVVEASADNPSTKAIMENVEMLAPCFNQ